MTSHQSEKQQALNKSFYHDKWFYQLSLSLMLLTEHAEAVGDFVTFDSFSTIDGLDMNQRI